MEIQWSLVLFTAISGAGAVLFACVGINEFKALAKNQKGILATCVIAAVLLALGGVCSATHLSHVERMLAVLTHPAPGIFLEALLIGIDAVLAIVYFLFVKRGVGQTPRKVVAVCAIAMGIIFPFSCGSSYMMSSQLAWNTIALPAGYLGTALPSGVAAWAIINHVFNESDESKNFVGLELSIASVVSIILGGIFGITSGAIANEQAVLFWVGIILVGSIVPLICGVLLNKRANQALTLGIVGFACGMCGSIAYRVLMWTGSVALMSLFGVTI